jgi:peroxiredoxin/tetratricopeptide (TPR) repeat protein
MSATILAAALAASLTAGGPPALDKPAPDFSLPTLGAQTLRLSRLHGKIVVLNFFATWCPPCRAETPDLLTSEKRYARRGVTFVGIDQREDAALVGAFAKAKGIRYTIALDTGGSASRRYDVRAIPSTYVIDRQGIVRYRQVDQLDAATLNSVLAAAVANKAPPQTPVALHFASVCAVAGRQIADLTAKAAGALARRDVNAAQAAAGDAIKLGERANRKLDALSNGPQSSSIDYFRSTQQRDALYERLAAAYELRAHADADAVAAKKDEEQGALLRGQIAANREQFADALRWYARAVSLAPNDGQAYDGEYLAAYEMRDYAKAADIAKDKTIAAPSDPESWLTVASADLPLKRYAQARDAAREALTLAVAAYAKDPTKAKSAYEVGRVWLKMARVELAAGNIAAARPFLRDASAAAPRTIVAQQAAEQLAALAPSGAVIVALGGAVKASGNALSPAHLFVTVRNPGAMPRVVHLSSAGVPPHWVLSFCYGTICDPYKSTLTLAPRASRRIELQVAPLADAGGRWSMTIQAANSATLRVAISAKATRAAVTVRAT